MSVENEDKKEQPKTEHDKDALTKKEFESIKSNLLGDLKSGILGDVKSLLESFKSDLNKEKEDKVKEKEKEKESTKPSDNSQDVFLQRLADLQKESDKRLADQLANMKKELEEKEKKAEDKRLAALVQSFKDKIKDSDLKDLVGGTTEELIVVSFERAKKMQERLDKASSNAQLPPPSTTGGGRRDREANPEAPYNRASHRQRSEYLKSDDFAKKQQARKDKVLATFRYAGTTTP